MATIAERLAQLEADTAQLKAQQAATVIVARETLRGDWEAARINLDAIDPANAGTWTEAAFPPKA